MQQQLLERVTALGRPTALVLINGLRHEGRTYRYFEGEPLFPFGFGLSYTTFAYRNLRLPNGANAGDEVKVAVEVENTGKMAGEEAVQRYIEEANRAHHPPIHWLAGFERIALRATLRIRGTERT